MADTLQTSTLIKLATKYADMLVNQVNRASVLANLLPARLGYNAGGPNWVAQSSGHIAETHAEGSDIANFGSDAQAQATLGWGLYQSPFHVADEAFSRAAASGNPVANVALWSMNMERATQTLASKINADCYTGSGSNSIIGLATALSDSNTYAGIDQSTASYWQSNVSGSGTITTLTLDQIRKDLAATYIASGERPDVAVCHPDVFRKVSGLFDSGRQFMTPSSMGLGTVSLGETAVPSISIDGCYFVEDKDGYSSVANGAADGSIYYLNSRHVYFEYISYEADHTVISGSAPGTSLPFAMDFKALSAAGNSQRATVRCQVQLVVDKPSSCAIRNDIDTA